MHVIRLQTSRIMAEGEPSSRAELCLQDVSPRADKNSDLDIKSSLEGHFGVGVENRNRFFNLNDDTDPLIGEFRHTSLSPAERRVAVFSRALVRAFVGDVGEFFLATDDGGITLEFSSTAADRDFVLAVPDDASVIYFSAHAKVRLSEKQERSLKAKDAIEMGVGTLAFTSKNRGFPEKDVVLLVRVPFWVSGSEEPRT